MSSICQSCGMPLENEMDLGTNIDNRRNRDYCYHCFRLGKFTNEKITLSEMINIAVTHLHLSRHMDKAIAQQHIENTLPKLKRWETG